MQRTQVIRCPNCGSSATRHFVNDEQSAHTQHFGGEIIRTECPICDYLMIMRSLDGSIVEAYAPGISFCWNESLESGEETDISGGEVAPNFSKISDDSLILVPSVDIGCSVASPKGKEEAIA
ncbi:MAG: hypothetical protein AAF378_11175 [Cyanobacteria bacterium P01_A01_bin.84]